MKNIFKFIAILGLFSFLGCVDLEFDEPPAQVFETLDTNTTIADLKALHISGDFETLSGDKIIEGIVVADDATGNAYKSFFIQDATGGIEILINDRNLYVTYPIGRKVYIKCNGLFMGDYNGSIRIGGSVDGDRVNGIESALVPDFIVIGELNNTIEPKLMTIDQLSDKDLHTLIKLENVQFANSDAGQVFAVDKVNTNRTMEDCNGNQIVARTSGYASFASELTPEGKGTAIGVYTKFGTTKQFFIRTPEELPLNGERCGSIGGGGDTTPNTTIAELKALHTLGNFESLSGGKIIEGVIIGDDASGNLYKQIIIQDATGGINVKINATDLNSKGLTIGKKIAVKCDGLDLGDNNELIGIGSTYEKDGETRFGGINESQIANVIVIGTSNNDVVMEEFPLKDIGSAKLQTLIKVTGVEFVSADSGKTFADAGNADLNRTLTDCEDTPNNIVIRTSRYADFADQLTPTGNGSFVGILTTYKGTNQLIVRDPSDLEMTSPRCTDGGGGGGTAIFEETFDGLTKYDILDLSGWTNIAEVGSDEQRWFANNFEGKEYASVSAYQAVETENTIWLITPSFDATTAKTFKFESAQHHWKTGGLSIWISNDFDGSNLGSANWTEVTCTLPTDANEWYEWVPSGNINLQDYFSTDNVKVAFKYEGNKDSNTTGFNIDNVILEE